MKKTVIFLLASAVLMFCTCGCSERSKFSSVRNENSWTAELYPLNTKLEEQFTLKSGGSIAVFSDISSGKLKIVITAPNGVQIYEGNGGEIEKFEVMTDSDGVYTFSLDGKNAEGKVIFTTEL